MLSFLIFVLILLSSAGQQPPVKDKPVDATASGVVEEEPKPASSEPSLSHPQENVADVLSKSRDKLTGNRAKQPLVLSLVPAYQGLLAELGDSALFDNRSLIHNFAQLEQIAPNYLMPPKMRNAALYFSLGLDLEKRFVIPQLSPTTQVVELQIETSYFWQSYFMIDRSYRVTWQLQKYDPLYSWLSIETLLRQIPLLAASLESLAGQSVSEIARNEQALLLQAEELFSQLTVLLAPMNGFTLVEEEPFLANFVTQFGMDSTLFYAQQPWSFDLLARNVIVEFPVKSVFSPRAKRQLPAYSQDAWRLVNVDVFSDDILENIEKLARVVWGEWFYWQGDAYG